MMLSHQRHQEAVLPHVLQHSHCGHCVVEERVVQKSLLLQLTLLLLVMVGC